ncbi:hypothetical protein ACOMHN_021928 [Nucella lapillus]
MPQFCFLPSQGSRENEASDDSGFAEDVEFFLNVHDSDDCEECTTAQLDNDITEAEIWRALQKLKSGKASGPDGVKGMRGHLPGPPGHGDSDDPIDSSCELIRHYHCDYFHDDPHCGTDKRTYQNMCEFSKAHCELRDLHISHGGACVRTTTTTTTTSTTTITTITSSSSSGSAGSSRASERPGGEDTVYRFFCLRLAHQQCGADLTVLCGSNGVTYTNLCQFEKARCEDQSLTVTSYLTCPVEPP